MAKISSIDIEETVIGIVSALASEDAKDNVVHKSKLKHDLGFDSLRMLELCVSIEGALNVSLEKHLSAVKTVGDVISLVKGGSGSVCPADADRRVDDTFNVDDYPFPKTERHIRKLKRYMRFSRVLWRFEVSGINNLPADGSYIICPNHQSHFDGLWIWEAIAKSRSIDLCKICCLAKQEHLENKFTRSWLTLLGGIPIDRRGNSVPSMKRALTCINDGYTMLIHPEGTRTRDGKMHEFKGGAAKLSIDAGVPVIPVRIDGAWEIFPPHRKLPKIFRLGGRYPIKIAFGEPIQPDGKSVEELTALLQGAVEGMGDTV